MRCLNCHQVILHQVTWYNLFSLPQTQVICNACQSELKKITGAKCLSCSRPMEKPGLCPDCKRWEEDERWSGVLDQNISIFHYNEQMKDIMARWKYRGDYILADLFREAMQDEFQEHFMGEDVVVVPIPLSDERMEERGFNQADTLAGFIQAPVKLALTRLHGEKQSKKSRQERMDTVNPFLLAEPVHQAVLLVDDIYTTGMTLRHAAKLLKTNGTPKIFSLTLIRSG
ncbi:competence protein ComFC [Thalassobacillus cyri]|uniref:Competence protein ComFC n=1 Tax=Thalassobacillus cyri TaxID=571932 RepID=A0A1H4ATT6_9BACI|nr:ComF family protein [Thalassobacillus cyri]SEA39290.1 competence protein ComFC [Thalassobacillus cyri]